MLSDNQLAQSLTAEMYRLVKILRREAQSGALLSLTERAVLSRLHPDKELLSGELAAREKVSTQAMSQITGHLLDLGLITRTPSGEDRRKFLISLTDAGRSLVTERQQAKYEWLAQAIHDRLTDAEKRILSEAIPLLTKLAST